MDDGKRGKKEKMKKFINQRIVHIYLNSSRERDNSASDDAFALLLPPIYLGFPLNSL